MLSFKFVFFILVLFKAFVLLCIRIRIENYSLDGWRWAIFKEHYEYGKAIWPEFVVKYAEVDVSSSLAKATPFLKDALIIAFTAARLYVYAFILFVVPMLIVFLFMVGFFWFTLRYTFHAVLSYSIFYSVSFTYLFVKLTDTSFSDKGEMYFYRIEELTGFDLYNFVFTRVENLYNYFGHPINELELEAKLTKYFYFLVIFISKFCWFIYFSEVLPLIIECCINPMVTLVMENDPDYDMSKFLDLFIILQICQPYYLRKLKKLKLLP